MIFGVWFFRTCILMWPRAGDLFFSAGRLLGIELIVVLEVRRVCLDSC